MNINKIDIKATLEGYRTELRAGRISYNELARLQSLAEYIEPGDVELLEAAGVPEGKSPQDIQSDSYAQDTYKGS